MKDREGPETVPFLLGSRLFAHERLGRGQVVDEVELVPHAKVVVSRNTEDNCVLSRFSCTEGKGLRGVSLLYSRAVISAC